MNKPIRTSAKALILREGKMLAIKLLDEDGEFFILPGGGQEGGEPLPDAVRREVLEETGIEVDPRELSFVIEGPKNERSHRIDLVFLCDYVRKVPNAALHGDTNQVGFEWLDVSMLNLLPLYPSRLRRAIMNKAAGKPAPVYLGCESEGDPECRD